MLALTYIGTTFILFFLLPPGIIPGLTMAGWLAAPALAAAVAGLLTDKYAPKIARNRWLYAAVINCTLTGALLLMLWLLPDILDAGVLIPLPTSILAITLFLRPLTRTFTKHLRLSVTLVLAYTLLAMTLALTPYLL